MPEVNPGLDCIRFTSRAGRYCTGDIASFPPPEAARYVEMGRASYWDLKNGKFAASAPKSGGAAPAGGDAVDWPDDGEPDPAPKLAKPKKRRVRNMQEGSEDFEKK